jgi:NAD(P)-dependent dehydrogenase (short-subunit alcohol dehydrogenase family)
MHKNSHMNPVVLITGASRGIGAACVERFVKRAWRVCGVALPDTEFRCRESESLLCISGDITSEEVRQTAVSEAIRRFGRIDVLVNNAGVGLYASPSETSHDLFLRLLETNLVAPLALSRLVIPAMRHRRSGIIINIGSVGAYVALPWAAAYSSSKFALRSITDSLRVELRQDGIQVVTICPGIVDTKFRQNVLGGVPPPSVKNLRPVVPVERVADAVIRAVDSRRSRTVFVPQLGIAFSAMRFVAPALMDWYLGRLYASRLDSSPIAESATVPERNQM